MLITSAAPHQKFTSFKVPHGRQPQQPLALACLTMSAPGPHLGEDERPQP